MKNLIWVRVLFAIAAIYDLALGVFFLVAAPWAYETAGVTPPNHWGYIHFPAALLIVFGFMFFAIAARPNQNRNLIPYGVGLKVAYCAVVFGHWFAAGLPGMWKPFAVVDLVMAVLFLWAYAALRPRP